MKKQIEANIRTRDMHISSHYRIGSTAFSLRYGDTDTCCFKHSPVIISIPERNYIFSAELFDVFLFLYIMVFTGKDVYLAINPFKFFFCSPECVGSKNMNL